MARLRHANKLSAAGLIALALLAVALSAAALMQHRPSGEQATPTTAVPAETGSQEAPQDSPDAGDSAAPEATATGTGEPVEAGTEPVTAASLTVVVIGDSFSVGDGSRIWVDDVADAFGWEDVVNLSSPGRGFIAQPRNCDFSPCGTFGASIPAIAEASPDLVITFGGTADGDYGIGDLTASYFQQLRDALPDAELVAISPVTTEDSAPYYLSMHNGTISTAVEAAEGAFIDVGQPGLGDGDMLTGEAHAEIAGIVTAELSAVLG